MTPKCVGNSTPLLTQGSTQLVATFVGNMTGICGPRCTGWDVWRPGIPNMCMIAKTYFKGFITMNKWINTYIGKSISLYRWIRKKSTIKLTYVLGFIMIISTLCITVSLIHMVVSWNRGTPKSSILVGFFLINQPFWIPPFMETPILLLVISLI